MANLTTAPIRFVPPCALCYINGHTTDKCLSLPDMKEEVLQDSDNQLDDTSPIIEVPLPATTK